MRAAPGRMHIDNASRQYATASGEQRTSRCYLLRRSFRDEQGRPRNETLANLSALPDHVLGALAQMLRGAALVDAGEAFEVEILGERRPARVQAEPLYDPSGSRMRS